MSDFRKMIDIINEAMGDPEYDRMQKQKYRDKTRQTIEQEIAKMIMVHLPLDKNQAMEKAKEAAEIVMQGPAQQATDPQDDGQPQDGTDVLGDPAVDAEMDDAVAATGQPTR